MIDTYKNQIQYEFECIIFFQWHKSIDLYHTYPKFIISPKIIDTKVSILLEVDYLPKDNSLTTNYDAVGE